MEDEFLTAEETASRLKLHPRTVRRMLSRGELPGRRLGKEWRVSAAELRRFIESGNKAKLAPEKGE